MSDFDFDRGEILPDDPDLEVLHDREYRVRAFRKGDNLLLRGAVRDQKPPGLYIASDPEPLTMHHMQVDLDVELPSMVITAVSVVMRSHPHEECPGISAAYEQLVGLSISRGYINKVRELFGGPRGCTHTTALLLAMGPVAAQCMWSVRASNAKAQGADMARAQQSLDPETRNALRLTNLNTCHVWAEDGPVDLAHREGKPFVPPLFIRKRLQQLADG